jgi:hypothetical protein
VGVRPALARDIHLPLVPWLFLSLEGGPEAGLSMHQMQMQKDHCMAVSCSSEAILGSALHVSSELVLVSARDIMHQEISWFTGHSVLVCTQARL